MKRLLLPIVAMILMTACQKEMPGGRMVTLKVRMEGNSKCRMHDHTPWWHDGDLFYINNGESGSAVRSDGGNCEIEDILEADRYTAVFPKSIVSGTPDISSASDIAVKMPRTFQYDEEEGETGIQKFNIPMVGLSDSSATTMQFKNVGGLIKVVVSDLPAGETIDSIVVTHNKVSLSGTGTITNVRSASPVLSCTGNKEVSLVFAGSARHGNGTYYLPVPVIASNSSYAFTINVCVHNTSTYVPKCYGRTQHEGGGYISRNSMATVPFAVSQDLVKPFDHYYFMMSDDRRVARSSGILYCCTTDEFNGYAPYYFEDGQMDRHTRYEYIEYYRDILKFRYYNFLPWSEPLPPPVSNNEAHYYMRELISAMDGMRLSECEFADNVPGATGYFTPTGAEWNYLLTHSRVGGASVEGGIGGVVVLPYNWDGTECEFKEGFAADSAGFRNSYTAAQWEYMEAHGAMILPIFGAGLLGTDSHNEYLFYPTYYDPISDNKGAYWLKNTADSCLYISYGGAEIKSMAEVEPLVTEYSFMVSDLKKVLCTVRLMKDTD